MKKINLIVFTVVLSVALLGILGVANGASEYTILNRSDNISFDAYSEYLTAGNPQWVAGIGISGGSPGSESYRIAEYANYIWTTRLQLDKGGNVGIGTMSPIVSLHNNGDFITKGPWVDARGYNGGVFNDVTIKAAITAIGTVDKKTLLLAPGTWTISDILNPVTVPTNINLRFEQGAFLSISTGIIFTINGPIDAPLSKIFSVGTTSGKVVFGSNIHTVFPQWWGAVADGAAGNDDTDAIQAALDTLKETYLVGGTYNTTKPLTMGYTSSLKGAGKRTTIISKSTNTVGTGTRIYRNGAVGGYNGIDNYAVDSIISIVHEDNVTANYVKIKGISLDGNTAQNNAYAIYALRIGYSEIEDIVIYRCNIGYYSQDNFLSQIRCVLINDPVKAVQVDNDGSGLGCGTTMLFEDIGCIGATSSAYDIYGVSYSTFINCAADNTNGTPYRFLSCAGLVLNGCGVESVTLTSTYPSMIQLSGGSSVTLIGFRSVGPIVGLVGTPGSSAMLWFENSEATFINCKLENFSPANNSNNIIYTGENKVYFHNTNIAFGGPAWVDFTGNSILLEIDNRGIVITDAAINGNFAGGLKINTHHIVYGTAPPAGGTWLQGDILYNTATTATGPLGWKCTVAGTPGTWVPFGGQAAAQANSTAGSVSALRTDFNALLAKLRAAGLMAP